jgi:prepilin-type N-terminal cleavage/methylation domain-containing protein
MFPGGLCSVLFASPLVARAPARTRTRRGQIGGDRGFTLVELLVTMVIALVAFTAVASLLVRGMDDQVSVQNRVSQLEEAQAVMQRLVFELREATSVAYVSSSSISYSEPVASGSQNVSFSCSTSTEICTTTTLGVTQTAITGVTNSNVFTASPSTSSPRYIGIELVVSAPEQNPVSLTDGVGLRNVTLGS